MTTGLLDLSWWQLVLVVLLLTHVTIVSVTVYLHRCQAHRALDLHPVLAHFFRFWLWLTTGMVTREWVGVHRRHHARCETPEDPHSPQVLGLKKVLWEGAELYRDATKRGDLIERYSRGTPDDWIETHLYRRYSVIGVSASAVCVRRWAGMDPSAEPFCLAHCHSDHARFCLSPAPVRALPSRTRYHLPLTGSLDAARSGAPGIRLLTFDLGGN